jgi:hypothetical protein
MASPDTRRTERSGMSSDTPSRDRIHAAIAVGLIPDHRPDHLWGGRASRGNCAACRMPVKMGEVVLEIQYIEDGGARTTTHDVHIRCYVALEDEWNRREAAGLTQHSPGSAASDLRREDRS